MEQLQLLFTKDGIQYQISRNKNVSAENSFFTEEDSPKDFIDEQLTSILGGKNFKEISIISALNHFTLMPEGFSEHELGYDLIAFNANVDRDNEELMLSVNKKAKTMVILFWLSLNYSGVLGFYPFKLPFQIRSCNSISNFF